VTTDVVVKILAVVGGGVVGGVAVGLLAQLLMRAFTVGKLSRWPILIVRLLGGVVCAWLLVLWLFGGGGSGIGGLGGWGFGSGTGKGEGDKPSEADHKDNDGKKNDGDKKTPEGATLRIEVLGDDALSEPDKKDNRRYRLETKEGPQLLTLADIQKTMKQRQQEQPPLRRLEIVLYKDSPDERVAVVSQLVSWGRELNDGKMIVVTSTSSRDAPRK
jgi:hypothetical protein